VRQRREAYSIAVLLFEQFRAANKVECIQVFATDIDERALEIARQGVYPTPSPRPSRRSA
jgi:two-component system CheB/CheR fusion protein